MYITVPRRVFWLAGQVTHFVRSMFSKEAGRDYRERDLVQQQEQEQQQQQQQHQQQQHPAGEDGHLGEID
jgi:hypothetical protein